MDTGDLVVQLENISEALGDLSISTLREALESGDVGAVADEKRLAKARRSIDKAIDVLRNDMKES